MVEQNQNIRELSLDGVYRDNDAAIQYFITVTHQMVSLVHGLDGCCRVFERGHEMGLGLYDENETEEFRFDIQLSRKLASFAEKTGAVINQYWSAENGELPSEVVAGINQIREEASTIAKIGKELFPHMSTQYDVAIDRLSSPIVVERGGR